MWQQALADATLVRGIAFAARWRNINFWLFSRRQVLLLSLVHPMPLSVVNYTSMFFSLLDPVSLQMWQQALADASFVSAIVCAARWRNIDFLPFFPLTRYSCSTEPTMIRYLLSTIL